MGHDSRGEGAYLHLHPLQSPPTSTESMNQSSLSSPLYSITLQLPYLLYDSSELSLDEEERDQERAERQKVKRAGKQAESKLGVALKG